MNIAIELLLIALGGGIGAWLRGALAARFDRQPLFFPWGTFAANASASFILGAIVGYASIAGTDAFFDAFADVGFCAALSTFSSLAWQIVEMLRRKLILNAAVYASTTFVCGISLFEAANIAAAYIAFL